MQVINDDLRSLISNESRSLPVAVDVVACRKKNQVKNQVWDWLTFFGTYICMFAFVYICSCAFLYFHILCSMPASGGFGWKIVRLRMRHCFFVLHLYCLYICSSKLIVAVCLFCYCQLGCDENWKAAIVTLVFCPGLTSSLLGGFSEPDIIIWLLSGHKKIEGNQIRKVFNLAKFLSTRNVKVWTKAFELGIQTSWSLGVRPTPVNSWISKGSNLTKV